MARSLEAPAFLDMPLGAGQSVVRATLMVMRVARTMSLALRGDPGVIEIEEALSDATTNVLNTETATLAGYGELVAHVARRSSVWRHAQPSAELELAKTSIVSPLATCCRS